MRSPQWLKPGILGAIVGGVVTMVSGFSAGGWYLSSSAEKMADTRSEVAVIDALVPVCIGNAKADPETVGKLNDFAAIKSSYDQRDFVMKAGWATMPATDTPNRELATACAEVLANAAKS